MSSSLSVITARLLPTWSVSAAPISPIVARPLGGGGFQRPECMTQPRSAPLIGVGAALVRAAPAAEPSPRAGQVSADLLADAASTLILRSLDSSRPPSAICEPAPMSFLTLAPWSSSPIGRSLSCAASCNKVIFTPLNCNATCRSLRSSQM